MNQIQKSKWIAFFESTDNFLSYEIAFDYVPTKKKYIYSDFSENNWFRTSCCDITAENEHMSLLNFMISMTKISILASCGGNFKLLLFFEMTINGKFVMI